MTGVRRTAAALGLLVVVGGCSTGTSVSRGTPTASPSSSFTASVSPDPAVTSSPYTRPVASPTSPAGDKDFGYFTAVEATSPPKLGFDRALFLSGAAAVKASEAHGDGSTVPNDYYIVNDNKLVRV